MKPEFIETRNMLDECPKCGKHSLAQQGHDKYHCLWCGFYRDISQPQGGGLLIVAAIFVVVLIVSLANQRSLQTPELSVPDSSNVPAVEAFPDERSQLPKSDATLTSNHTPFIVQLAPLPDGVRSLIHSLPTYRAKLPTPQSPPVIAGCNLDAIA